MDAPRPYDVAYDAAYNAMISRERQTALMAAVEIALAFREAYGQTPDIVKAISEVAEGFAAFIAGAAPATGKREQ